MLKYSVKRFLHSKDGPVYISWVQFQRTIKASLQGFHYRSFIETLLYVGFDIALDRVCWHV